MRLSAALFFSVPMLKASIGSFISVDSDGTCEKKSGMSTTASCGKDRNRALDTTAGRMHGKVSICGFVMVCNCASSLKLALPSPPGCTRQNPATKFFQLAGVTQSDMNWHLFVYTLTK